MVKIIYEDEDLLLIDKPPGLVVTPSQTQKEETLADILKRQYGTGLERGGVVHRLDKDTSGVLLVAKTQKALENLQSQFKQRKVKKEYLALVHGHVKEGGVVDAAISRNPGNREKFTVLPGFTSKESKPTFEVSTPSRWPKGLLEGGRWAVTEYEPLKLLAISQWRLAEIFNDLNKIQMRKLERMNYNKFTLLLCQPKTGRTHQIRVHLKYIHHPAVSDEKYVGRKMFRLDKRWCPRMFLHAKKIGFYHPVTGKWMEVESELPEDLRYVLESLRSLEQ